MGRITKRDKDALDQLVLDCTMYNFDEKEALEYIKNRFGKNVSGRTYRRYKKDRDNGNKLQEWLNHFTKIGFVMHHKKQIDTIERIQNDNLSQLFTETETKEQRDEDKILKIKHDIRENVKLLSDLGLGTPIISHIKAEIDKAKNRYNQLIEKIRMHNPELFRDIY